MNHQQMLDIVAKVNKIAKDIDELADNLGRVGPWEKWYAWYPVYTVSNQRVWLKSIYRRTQGQLFKRYAGYDYATDFDLLKEDA
jgi:hypothetical protein